MKKHITTIALALAVIAAPILQTGCTTTDRSVVVHIGVSYAVAKVVKGDAAKAQRIIAISSAVRAIAGGEAANSVALLDTYIRSKIDWTKLKPEDAMLANLLLAEIKIVLEKKVGTGPLDSAKLLVVAEVAGWIEDAARAAVPTVTPMG
jgi:hypothetical protein